MEILRRDENLNIIINGEQDFQTNLGWQENLVQFEDEILSSIINPIENYETVRYIHSPYTCSDSPNQTDIWYYFHFIGSNGRYDKGLDYNLVGISPEENSKMLKQSTESFFRLEFYKTPNNEPPTRINRKLVFTRTLSLPLGEKYFYTTLRDYIHVPVFMGSNYKNKENMYLFWFQDESVLNGTTFTGNTFFMTAKFMNAKDGTINDFVNDRYEVSHNIVEEEDMYYQVDIDKTDLNYSYQVFKFNGTKGDRVGTVCSPIHFYEKGGEVPAPTPTPTATPTPTQTPTQTATPTPTETPTNSGSESPALYREIRISNPQSTALDACGISSGMPKFISNSYSNITNGIIIYNNSTLLNTDKFLPNGDSTGGYWTIIDGQLKYAATFAPSDNGAISTLTTCTLAEPTYEITGSPTSILEGETVTFTITTTNVLNNSIRYFNFSNTSQLGESDFDPAPTYVVTINNNVGTFTLTAKSDLLFDGYGVTQNETFEIDLFKKEVDNSLTFLKKSNTITVVDSSTTPINTTYWNVSRCDGLGTGVIRDYNSGVGIVPDMIVMSTNGTAYIIISEQTQSDEYSSGDVDYELENCPS